MAKRKRLTPVPMGPAGGEDLATLSACAASGALEADGAATVADLPLPQAPRSRVPIAADAASAASEAALSDMAQHLETARHDGRLAVALPLDAIVADHLTRDRIAVDEGEMSALIDSIAMRGQQAPIDVVALSETAKGAAPRYGLISGWRRLAALQHLREVTGEPRYDTVLAVLRRPAHAGEAYVAMVEENEIRANLSHYERARIVAQTVRQGVYPDATRALRALFGMASRSRRSKIGSFLVVVEALDDVLSFPTLLPERLGLTLARRLEAEPELAAALRRVLAHGAETAEGEQERIRDVLERAGPAAPSLPPAHRSARAPSPVAPSPVAPSPTSPAAADRPAADIRVRDEGARLILSGPGLTPAVRADLMRWLQERARG